ncbi:alpha/beta fold hydrolase [Streptomyces griseus]|uniref:alpha/beta fold hydrolase n=1 Tax=Streptomyces griseus TaxID=1911 RepID=UPI00373AF5AB
MVHGEPTWGYEWRHLIEPLSRHHRVVVPDHMGFGKSETPQDHSYDAAGVSGEQRGRATHPGWRAGAARE